MPISEEEFRRGRTADSLTERIWKYFKDQPDQAHSAEEVAEATGQVKPRGPNFDLGRGLSVLGVQLTLSEWARRGILESRMVQDSSGASTLYYKLNPQYKGQSEVRWS